MLLVVAAVCNFSLTLFTETNKFVEANTQELAKDKWLCPLSGKKFRGPDFVRKHIFNKHMDKVEAVRMEVIKTVYKVEKKEIFPEWCTVGTKHGTASSTVLV